jgi:hypothetical protein
LEKKHVDDLKMKKHKAAVHKEAVHLYLQERAKPEGGVMSLRQVQDQIKKIFCDCSLLVHLPLCKWGSIIASPKQMGPPGTIAKANYKLVKLEGSVRPQAKGRRLLAIGGLGCETIDGEIFSRAWVLFFPLLLVGATVGIIPMENLDFISAW